uniref:Truncated non-structural protein 3c n=1 Tax=Feline coronavirus TaxID=12663 RepID=A0A2Z6FAC4_9ALPC|nr:truncated non-structural protein 3c [Feline coronavirus]
MIGGLFLTL